MGDRVMVTKRMALLDSLDSPSSVRFTSPNKPYASLPFTALYSLYNPSIWCVSLHSTNPTTSYSLPFTALYSPYSPLQPLQPFLLTPLASRSRKSMCSRS